MTIKTCNGMHNKRIFVILLMHLVILEKAENEENKGWSHHKVKASSNTKNTFHPTNL